MDFPGSLHNHTHRSNFCLRDCIIKEEDLINYAVELGHEVVAITDHETISAAVVVEKIYKKIKEKNIPLKVIMGNEIYLCRDDLTNNNFDSITILFFWHEIRLVFSNFVNYPQELGIEVIWLKD